MKQGYVTDEYIGTPGCLASPGLCGRRLNRFKGVKPVPPVHKPSDNLVEANITGIGRERR
jgi:hypothetical protein